MRAMLKSGFIRTATAIFAVLALGAALILALVPGPGEAAVASAEEAAVPIDMYLIGGQSNAVGYSVIKDDVKNEYTSTSYDNIMYAGEVEYNISTRTPRYRYIDDISDYRTSITLGLGSGANYIGPEFGIAQKLNDLYGPGGVYSDRKAIIFKTAAGGTALRDISSGLSGTYGNWFPRSQWPKGHNPEQAGNLTGALYNRFVKNFGTVYNELVENGYAPEVKGMFWMQGEDDKDYAKLYQPLLEALIHDLRTDISDITGNPDDMYMPFVIGKIAVTFQLGSPYDPSRTNIPEFNEAQQAVADDPENAPCACVETEDLIIVEPGTGTIKGSDNSHFNDVDEIELGRRAGDKLIDLNGALYVATNKPTGGTVTAEFNADKTAIEIHVSAEHRRKLLSLKVNGEDVTVTDGAATYAVQSGVNRYIVEALFVGSSVIKITPDYDISMGKVEYERIYEGEKLSVSVKPAAGYKVESVSFGGTALTYNADTDRYESGEIYADGSLTVVFARINAASDKKGGCKKGNLALALALLGTVAAAAVIIKK